MTTVPELKAEAKSLGITGYSAMRKPELIHAIGNKVSENSERYGRSGLRAESDSNKIDNATPSAIPTAGLTKAERASQAGKRDVPARPMDSASRKRAYRTQNGSARLTPAQSRRMRKKGNKHSGMLG